MIIHSIWRNVDPNYEVHLRRANEARAAAVYAGWKWLTGRLGAAVRRLVEANRRAAQMRRTSDALHALSDSQLKDIGVARGEIESIARAVAAEPAGGTVTLADLPRIRSAGVAGGDERRGRPAPWAAKRPESAAANRRRAA